MKDGNSQKRRGLHQIALAALFTIGDTILRFPWANAEAGVTVSFLLSAVAAVGAVFAGYPLARFLFRRPLHRKAWRVILAVGAAIAVGITAWFCAAQSTEDILRFMQDTLLPKGTSIAFVILFLVSAVLLARVSRRGLDLFSLIAFFSATLAVIVLFLQGIPQFRPAYGTLEIPSTGAILLSLKTLLPKTVLPMIPLVAYCSLSAPSPKGNRNARPLAVGVLAGFALMLLCVLQTLLTFGAPYAATLTYPYSRAVRVVSVGQYAFRPEILSYVLDYAASLIRTALCFACMRRLIGRFLPRLGRMIPIFAAIAVFVFLYLR